MMRNLPLVLGLAAAAACAGPPALPPPVFTRTTGLPGFVVECRNTTDRAMSPSQSVAALRLDGVVTKSRGSIGSFPGGVPTDVSPGGSWKVLVVLHPGTVNHSNSIGLIGTGAMLQADWGVPLSKGQHTVAFECAGNWSEAVSFGW